MINSPITAPGNRVPRSFALRTQAAGQHSFQRPRRSTTETKRSIRTNRGPTPRAFCKPALASSILPPIKAS